MIKKCLTQLWIRNNWGLKGGGEGGHKPSPGGGGVNAQKSFWADMSSAGMRRAELWVF